MKEAGISIQTLNNDFSLLTEENRQSVIEMIKFLVITQNAVIPGLFNLDEHKFIEEEAPPITNEQRSFL